MYKIVIVGGNIMENIPSSFMGYNKQAVNDIIKQKDDLLVTQQKDINYLRGQLDKLEKEKQKPAKKVK